MLMRQCMQWTLFDIRLTRGSWLQVVLLSKRGIASCESLKGIYEWYQSYLWLGVRFPNNPSRVIRNRLTSNCSERIDECSMYLLRLPEADCIVT